MLTLLYGTRGARAEIYNRIAADAAEGRRAYLIVPDQKALLAEEALMHTLPRSAALLVDAVGFSRLANLVCRRYGSLTYRYATEGAKVVTMYRALGKLRPHLRVFDGELRRGTLEALCSLCREFRTCAVTAADLESAADRLGDTPLADKLHDLTLLYTEYESVLHNRFAEAEDDLDTLADLLGEHNFFGDARVYIDSFISFTKQEMTVLSRMLSHGVDVTIALPFSRRGAHMAECADTRKKLLGLCARLSCELTETYIESDAPEALTFAKENLWDFAAPDRFAASTEETLEVVHCADKTEEIRLCLKEIYRAIAEGYSYADIAIIARNAESYTGTLDRMLERCNIPFFFSKKTDAELLPLTGLILSALSLYIGDFAESDVATYIKTGLVGLTDEECDLFEEYIDRWNIHGRVRYLDGENFTMSGAGYTAEETDPETLREINTVKDKVAAPLARLCDSLDGAKTVREFATAIFVYLEELGIREKSLEPALVRYFGVDKTADAIRLWNLTMEALDTLVDAAAEEETTAADFHALVRLLFSSIDIASIPSSKDQIIIGNADTIRIDERKIVLILGAVEGVFPAPVSESPTLCENERSILEGIGVTLSQSLRLRSARELYHFVRAIDFATNRVVISHYAADVDGRKCEPSFAVARLQKLFPNLHTYAFAALPPMDKLYYAAAAADSVGSFDKTTEAALREVLVPRGMYTPPLTDANALSNSTAALTADTAAQIYGDNIHLSQSKIDTYVDCKLLHFLRYILSLEDTAPFEFNPADTGNYVHSVLEKFLKNAKENGKRIADYTEQEIDSIARSLCAAETERILRSANGGSARMLCFFDRMYRNIRLVLTNLVEEFKNSSFEPFLFEYKIGLGGHKPLAVTLADGAKISLNGIADRVDIYKEDGKVYLRVADYKTGKKAFSQDDLVKGKNLQLLIYLYALCEVADKQFFDLVGAGSTEDIRPAGAIYFVVKPPRITCDAAPEGDGLAMAAQKLERKGFVFSVDALADAIDRSADKQFSKKLTVKDEAATAALYETVLQSITDIAGRMRAGKIDAAETEAGSKSPCRYCDYARICRKKKILEEEEESDE